MNVSALIAPVALAAALLLGGCNNATKTETTTTAPKASMGMVNGKCPFSGEPASAEHTAEYKGQTVGFCCGGCVKKFNKADDAAKAALVSKAK